MKLYNPKLLLIFSVFIALAFTQFSTDKRDVWSKKQANAWYEKQPWLVGSNFLPSTAINQLEMWQEDSFDQATIDKELGWAESLGMNTMRVYLHDLPFQTDSAGFFNRINIFLELSKTHHIKPILVIFDSCWDPYPVAGKQRAPKPFVHNSGWVQSPGIAALKDSLQYPRLEKYVKALVKRFATDDRILAWDVWNEPDNRNTAAYGSVELQNKTAYVLPLLEKTFAWARSSNPIQPLTSGVWAGNYTSAATLKPIEKVQLDNSDIITFHCYDKPSDFENKIKQLQRYGKPMICTEYMARPNGSTFEGFLPIGKQYKVGMINWGFVDGKSQTIYPWDSWKKVYTAEPPLWFHDIFRKDGSAYKPTETAFIKKMISAQ